MENKSLLSPQTAISISLALTLLAAAASFGVMYQKIEGVRSDVQELKMNIAALNNKVDSLLIKSVSIRP